MVSGKATVSIDTKLTKWQLQKGPNYSVSP